MIPDDLPPALDPARVGTYPALVGAGGGYVWDAVLEYRVWCSPGCRTPDHAHASDGFRAFASYAEASAFAQRTPGADPPLALVLQEEHVAEPEPGVYRHVREQRLTEWPVHLLRRRRRTADTIPRFLASDPPDLTVLRQE